VLPRVLVHPQTTVTYVQSRITQMKKSRSFVRPSSQTTTSPNYCGPLFIGFKETSGDDST
jgi:hypothetical protein